MIEVKHVTKCYGKFKAVDDVSLTALGGKITVLLGPNGAGKSTTIKSITNLLKFEGKIRICGYDNRTLEAKKSFAYIPETPVLYDLLTIEEHVEFIAKAYRLEEYKETVEQLLVLFHLEEKRKKIVKELSKGMRQKVSMLLALMISPKALLVDEPMMGLDPQSIEDTLRLLVDLKNAGVAVLVSTHIIDVFAEVWDEAYILNKGKIVYHATRENIGEESLKDIFFTYTDREVGDEA